MAAAAQALARLLLLVVFDGLSSEQRRWGAAAAAAVAAATTSSPLATDGADANSSLAWLPVTYNPAMQPLVRVTVGEQPLELVFDASSGDTLVFVSEHNACKPPSFRPCYSYKQAKALKTVRICAQNNASNCEFGGNYVCDQFLPDLENATAHADELVIDGMRYEQKNVEALEAVEVELELAAEKNRSLNWTSLPVRLLEQPLSAEQPQGKQVPLELFEGASGLLGASGRSLSCREENVWSQLLARSNATVFALDFQAPPQAHRARAFDAAWGNASHKSRVILSPQAEEDLVWSEQKQTGDPLNNAMNEFLMYHPTVCGVDLLYNTSSNWLTVLDTSGPCLMLPPFLFERLRAQVPLSCPFAPGERSEGRLCSPKRELVAGAQDGLVLPALRFQLEDDRMPGPGEAPPRVLELPLERLAFRNASGHELLCVSLDDSAWSGGADMLRAHISFGTVAVAALYTVVDIGAGQVGLRSKGNASRESTDRFCSAAVTCKSAMQTYYPPLNICEDPECSKYFFMTLDNETKTCIWYRSVPALFGVLLVALVTLDFLGHRLYAQATEKAAGLRPRQ